MISCDAALEMTEFIRHRFEPVEKSGGEVDGARQAVVRDSAQKSAPVGEVHGHLGGSAPGEPAPEGGEVDAVRHHEQHRVALLDAELGEPAGDALRALVHLPVGDGVATDLHDQRRVSQLRGGAGENASDAALLQGVLVGQLGHRRTLSRHPAAGLRNQGRSWNGVNERPSTLSARATSNVFFAAGAPTRWKTS